MGSNPTSSSNASLAQLAEQWSPKPEVSGSTPEGCAKGHMDEWLVTSLQNKFGSLQNSYYLCYMKKCPACTKDKPEDEFRKSKSRKDGYQPYCLTCDKEKQKEWYNKNKEKCIAKSNIRNAAARKDSREYVLAYLKEHPCINCGEEDPVVLDFDHIGNKNLTISQLVTRGQLTAIKEEIKQCQVLCANCHRRKTAKDFNWYKLG